MQPSKQDYDALLKFLLIGDSGVGKTCFLVKYCEGTFTNAHLSTIGIDYKLKYEDIDGKRVKLQIWDTAGQERFRTITQNYYKGAMGIILAYSVTDANSFKNIADWMKQIDQHADPQVKKVIIGTKSDDRDNRKVSTQQGQELAKQYGVPFFETSAKDCLNIAEAFKCIAQLTLANLEANTSTNDQQFKINFKNPQTSQTKKNEKCC